MCGIIGYAGSKSAGSVVVAGLKRLEYRGYDSAGIAMLNGGDSLLTVKTPGKVAELEAELGRRRSKLKLKKLF